MSNQKPAAATTASTATPAAANTSHLNLNEIIQRLKASHRVANDVQSIVQSICENLAYIQGRFPPVAELNDYYKALAYTIKDRLMSRWAMTASTYYQKASRTVCYLSAEFLIGPQLEKNILNLGLMDKVKEALKLLQLDYQTLIDQEAEPGLGNGGLGRLAACYMDSMATLNIPAIGYGIRYEFGIFDQKIVDGWQNETTDKWLTGGNPWEIERSGVKIPVGFGGHTEQYKDESGNFRVRWIPQETVQGIPFDTPIISYQDNTTNFIRLWKAEACESFDFGSFNVGDYYKAVQNKVKSENITKVLYPNDEMLSGKTLRLKQQFFFVSSSLQDMIRIYRQHGSYMGGFCDKYAIQMNDTHPAIAVAELMRLLIDEYQLSWDESFEITQKCCGFTNHTLLPEALECWPLPLFASILPRHLEIIYEINWRFLNSLPEAIKNDVHKLQQLSIIEEKDAKSVRMANLACIGSHTVNGVSALHSSLVKEQLFKEFSELAPKKFINVTNGVTPRRFLMVANPKLAQLLDATIGSSWRHDLSELRRLEALSEDKHFQAKWSDVKALNKKRLATFISEHLRETVDPQSLFDVQAKRIHEYKRQHLKILHILALYNRILNGNKQVVPRTFIFAGKAAPGYYMAKLIIKLINDIAAVINHDTRVNRYLKVVFVPNFDVKHAQLVYPGADLSEQISTAGLEASGTGNMKFAMNGALTIGTLDGANIEIREEVGNENFFMFGASTEELKKLSANYRPADYVERQPELKAAMATLSSKDFLHDYLLFQPLIDNLWNQDPYYVMADFASYIEAQDALEKIYMDKASWNKKSILNVARMAKFSSDRAILEYCEKIWHVKPVKIA